MIVVVMGVCGCGKSSVAGAIANETGWTFIEGDDLHPASNREKMASGTPLTDEDRWPWLDHIAAVAGQAAADGNGAVVACSALKRTYRDRLRCAGPNVRFVHLDGDEKLIETRMHARRDHFMPTGLLASQLATLEPPADDEHVLVYDIQIPATDIAARALRDLG